MRNARCSVYPKLPKSALETLNRLNSIEIRVYTSKSEPFMLINDIDNNLVIIII